jgi:hypothetical protein
MKKVAELCEPIPSHLTLFFDGYLIFWESSYLNARVRAFFVFACPPA